MQSELRSFAVGTYFYYQKDSLYFLFQLLENHQEELLVKSYWSTALLPTLDNMVHLDVKCMCEPFDSEYEDEFFETIGQTEITESQVKEIVQYQRIKASKEARQTEFILLKEQAKTAFEKRDYLEAIRLYSLAAPYSKYDMEIYLNRGLSYLEAKQYANALADFDYYLCYHPTDEQVLAAVEQAKKAL